MTRVQRKGVSENEAEVMAWKKEKKAILLGSHKDNNMLRSFVDSLFREAKTLENMDTMTAKLQAKEYTGDHLYKLFRGFMIKEYREQGASVNTVGNFVKFVLENDEVEYLRVEVMGNSPLVAEPKHEELPPELFPPSSSDASKDFDPFAPGEGDEEGFVIEESPRTETNAPADWSWEEETPKPKK